MEDSEQVRGADGRILHGTEMSCPVRVALHTSWVPVTLDTFPFVVMPPAYR